MNVTFALDLTPPTKSRLRAQATRSVIHNAAILALIVASVACGTNDDVDNQESSTTTAALIETFTGGLTVSTADAAVGAAITVTQSATNLTSSQLGPLILGVYRGGLRVQNVIRPRTGICRIAGSATCNFIDLAPGETQSYTLTLVPTVPGTVILRGWTSSSYVRGGSSEAVTVTIH
jgi:hypothetical protein